ncbi:MAG: NUDIX domain-containing protein [Bdellovibrionales bacterium]|nr:NUDIX domain-containing protein [Bdellovibrionales bacterium]
MIERPQNHRALPIQRIAARGLLIDQDSQHLLLMRIIVPDTGDSHWVTPGGGLDHGETEYACLVRELKEETGFTEAVEARPVWIRSCCFTFDRIEHQQKETFFWIPTKKFLPLQDQNVDEIEAKTFQEFRWWSAAEILESQENFIPTDLGVHFDLLLRHGLPENVIDITT